MTTNWKYTDNTKAIVTRTLDSGAIESCMVSAIVDWIAEGNMPTAADLPTAAQLQATYSAASQALLDSTAQAWSYNDIASAATYLNSAIAQFKAEATALCTWRDNFWYQAGLLQAQIQAGTADLPATTADFLALMPPVPTRPT